MSDSDTLDKSQALAKEFMALWQEQMRSMVANPDATRDAFMEMGKMPQEMMHKMGQAGSKGDAKNQSDDDHLSEHGDDELSRLKHRLAACEARLASLEARIKD